MASYGATHRSPTSSTPSASTPVDHQTYDPKESTQKNPKAFKLIFYCPFNIPQNPEAAALRIAKNLSFFGLYYALFIWIGLFISLIPEPVLHRIFDKRLVLALLAMATMVELIVTKAGIHLAVTLAIGIPIVLIHAVLWFNEDVFEGDEAASVAGELVPLTGDQKDSTGAVSSDMV
ncbi:PRA1 family protein [Quillaja saponaria]|uniref:PRA1 family protein n=1 Tax=Quillaja saponaria TaxID=32244 RepID=A0AAD7LS10_QUISA|nr:PRA1 family protein [Quillaja saponaria]